MKIWTTEEEAERLARRFQGVNRASFARDFQVSGGQSMIYQHITGRRPIGLEAAQAYARGFKCTLEEISPRLAAEARKAFSLTEDVGVAPADDLLTTEQKQMLSLLERLDKDTREIWMKIGDVLSQAKHSTETHVKSPDSAVIQSSSEQEEPEWNNASFRRLTLPSTPKVGNISTATPTATPSKKRKRTQK